MRRKAIGGFARQMEGPVALPGDEQAVEA